MSGKHNDMVRLHPFRPLVSKFELALHSFQTSDSKFRVLKTLLPSSPDTPQDPTSPPIGESPKTLFILDSSFNPPSIAHQTLAQSALHKDSTINFPRPHRLLLLFAIMNADKAPSPAAFEQRLALMTIFASDILSHLQAEGSSDHEIVPIDIGVTKVPYYTDKSLAITAEGREFYPDTPRHVHLIGFDTVTRFFNPKYYPSFSPPLSALDPFFTAGHSLRATLRPDDEYGSVDEQKAFLERLGNGDMEKDGGRCEWTKQVQLVLPNTRAGVSSTKIRRAARGGQWEEVAKLCTSGVTAWVKQEVLYADVDWGAKMA